MRLLKTQDACYFATRCWNLVILTRIEYAATICKHCIAAVMLAGFSLTIALPIAAGENESGSEVVYDVYHDTSRPVREYPDQLPLIPRGLQVKPLHQRLVPGAAVEQQDQAEQLFALPAVSANVSHNFEGMADSANGFVGLFVPPDSNLSVGATQVVEVINYRI